MDATQSYIKIYNINQISADDFEFDYTPDGDSLLTDLVPCQDNWGDLSWGIAFEEYEYASKSQIMYITLNTKWESPVEWLRNASIGTHYFENKLITMTTVQKDETSVMGVAIMDGEVLQNKQIFEMDLEKVQKYYNDNETEYDLENLDNQIWDSIEKFVKVCEQFYLEREEKND